MQLVEETGTTGAIYLCDHILNVTQETQMSRALIFMLLFPL